MTKVLQSLSDSDLEMVCGGATRVARDSDTYDFGNLKPRTERCVG